MCSRCTVILTIQYKSIDCNDWLRQMQIHPQDNCSFCHSNDRHYYTFSTDCKSLVFWGNSWTKWWENITDFNIKEEDHIHKSLLFGFP